MKRLREVTVLFEDESVIAIDKPSGLTAVPVKNSQMVSALALLTAALKERRQRALMVHRIDRFTSGVLLFAKSSAARDRLVRQFLAHKPVREYLAVVRGHLRESSGDLVHFLERQGMHQKVRRQIDKEATRAELRYEVDKELRGASLVRVQLVTGLQNQIRVQFAAIGHPVVGDRKYRPEEADERRIDRVALHAARLEFEHPMTGETVELKCPPPADFRSLIRSLQHKA